MLKRTIGLWYVLTAANKHVFEYIVVADRPLSVANIRYKCR